MKCLLGLITPDCGSIKIDGKELSDSHGQREKMLRRFGMTFSLARCLAYLSGRILPSGLGKTTTVKESL